MRSYSSIEAFRQRLGLVAAAPPPRFDQSPWVPFSDVHWREQALHRETADVFHTGRSWRIEVDPGDGALRQYYLNGTNREVLRRVLLIFPSPASIVVQPCKAGLEFVDRRFHTSTNRENLSA